MNEELCCAGTSIGFPQIGVAVLSDKGFLRRLPLEAYMEFITRV